MISGVAYIVMGAKQEGLQEVEMSLPLKVELSCEQQHY